MGLDEQLKKQLEEFRRNGHNTFPAIVESVDKDNKTIAAKDLEGFTFNEVRLTASIDEEKALVVYPKIGTTVLLSMIGNELEHLFVSSVSQVESLDVTIATTELHMDADGYRLKRGDEDLRQVLNDMIDELNKIVVIQGQSINVVAMTQIKARLNNILKA